MLKLNLNTYRINNDKSGYKNETPYSAFPKPIREELSLTFSRARQIGRTSLERKSEPKSLKSNLPPIDNSTLLLLDNPGSIIVTSAPNKAGLSYP